MKKTQLNLSVSRNAYEIVSQLQDNGYEAYIVGGAIRDLLLGRTPKDFDISTSATPEEVRGVFGRRHARIIGKRFRLVHVYMNGELFEVSTFRQAPDAEEQENRKQGKLADLPEHLIVSDNSFGSAEEDVWRRDFTVNALFYNPVSCEILDYTEYGVDDINNGIVRAIGNPTLRFEEDPVRMLRALKLVAQYDFTVESETENALFQQMHLIQCAAPSRLSLELEKILQSIYSDRHFEVFHDYGLLKYFLPEIDARWGSGHIEYMLDMLYERNCRVDEGEYRSSISLALAIIAIPFLERAYGREPGQLWDKDQDTNDLISEVVSGATAPHNMMVRMRMSAEKILQILPELVFGAVSKRHQLMQNRSYPHAREIGVIHSCVTRKSSSEFEAVWPFRSEAAFSGRNRNSSHKKKRQ